VKVGGGVLIEWRSEEKRSEGKERKTVGPVVWVLGGGGTVTLLSLPFTSSNLSPYQTNARVLAFSPWVGFRFGPEFHCYHHSHTIVFTLLLFLDFIICKSFNSERSNNKNNRNRIKNILYVK